MDSVGGRSLVAGRRKARSGGIVLWFGQASRAPVTDLATLVRLTADGRLHPEIGTLLPWERTPDVIDAIRERRLRGNAVPTLN